MERPLSTASTSATTPSGPIHKRTKSTPRVSPGPPSQALFLTNLRLLDLDLLPDWPAITPSTFSNTDARARIKAAEWSLYQLFRLFDPALTADKLQPFFPPLEPLQSINLRAALYRCLDGLKKNGFLGREVVLRKTMLDECAGDKFWEVCVTFSAIVLRKRVLGRSKKGDAGRPLAQVYGAAQALTKTDRDGLAPLLVAHRASLGKKLSDRQKLGEEFAQLEGVLREKEEDLVARRNELRRNGKSDGTERQLEKLRPLEEGLHKSWVGDEGLREALLSGGTAASGDRVLVEPTEALFDREHASNTRQAGRDLGLVEDIEVKARGQSLRMKRWQALYDRIQAVKPKPTPAEEARARGGSVSIRFDKHIDLTLGDTKQSRGKPSPTKATHSRAASACAGGYDNILAAMREELRRNQNARRKGSVASPDIRHGRSASDAVMGASRVSSHRSSHSRQHSRSPSLQYSPSQSPAPFRPGMGRRISSRSRSYQQPKVISQRGPIPLKTELFSPLKSARPSNDASDSASTSRPGSALAFAREDNNEAADGIDGALGSHTRQNSSFVASPTLPTPQEEEDEPTASIDSTLNSATEQDLVNSGNSDPASKVDNAFSFAPPSKTASPANMDPPKQDPVKDDSEFKKPSVPTSRYAPRPSLADRTRNSMAFSSTENTHALVSTPSAEPPSPAINTHEFPLPPSNITKSPLPTSPPQPTPSLADRTRQSISSFQPPTSIFQRQPSQRGRSRTSTFQQQQGSTTPSARRSSYAHLTPSREEEEKEGEGVEAGTSSKRVITPREQLFDAGVEYDSVFKSRPRVAHSPVMSPSVLEQDGEDFSMVGVLRDLDDDETVLGSSPLRR